MIRGVRVIAATAMLIAGVALLASCSTEKPPLLVSQTESDASSVTLMQRLTDTMTFVGGTTGWVDEGEQPVKLPLTKDDLTDQVCSVPDGLFDHRRDVGLGKEVDGESNEAAEPKSQAAAAKLAMKLKAHWKSEGYTVIQGRDPQNDDVILVTLKERDTTIIANISSGSLRIEGYGLCAKNDY